MTYDNCEFNDKSIQFGDFTYVFWVIEGKGNLLSNTMEAILNFIFHI